jgi:hypothetical protein
MVLFCVEEVFSQKTSSLTPFQVAQLLFKLLEVQLEPTSKFHERANAYEISGSPQTSKKSAGLICSEEFDL